MKVPDHVYVRLDVYMSHVSVCVQVSPLVVHIAGSLINSNFQVSRINSRNSVPSVLFKSIFKSPPRTIGIVWSRTSSNTSDTNKFVAAYKQITHKELFHLTHRRTGRRLTFREASSNVTWYTINISIADAMTSHVSSRWAGISPLERSA